MGANTGVMRHWNSAFSRGVGYEPHLPGRFFDGVRVAGYFIDFRPKTMAVSARDPLELLPAGLAQLALGWWERLLAGEEGASEEFDRLCRLLEQNAVEESGSYLWPYQMRDRKYGTEPPWISALAQAEAASVFVRSFLRGGRDRHAELALGAIRPLLEVVEPTVVALTPSGPGLEECPSDPPSLILNGWIYALWGLWDISVGLESSPAQEMLEASTACLRRTLPAYDVGWWSRYSLYPHLLPDLAKPFYHRLHITQLEILYRLTGYEEFHAFAQRWRRYDRWSLRATAVAQKVVFVASGYR
jgi:hypothetical protein